MSTHISAYSGEVVNSGSQLEVNGNVLKAPDLNDYALAHKYDKRITAKVNGEYVGWGYTPSFIFFKARREKIDTIEEITYWGSCPREEYCRYHVIVLIACGGWDSKQFYTDALTNYKGIIGNNVNESYLTHIRGAHLTKSTPQKISFRSFYDKRGELIKES